MAFLETGTDTLLGPILLRALGNDEPPFAGANPMVTSGALQRIPAPFTSSTGTSYNDQCNESVSLGIPLKLQFDFFILVTLLIAFLPFQQSQVRTLAVLASVTEHRFG